MMQQSPSPSPVTLEEDADQARIRVGLSILGHAYEISCAPEEEQELRELGTQLEEKLLEMQSKLRLQGSAIQGSTQEKLNNERVLTVYALNLMRKIERLRRYLEVSEGRLSEIVEAVDNYTEPPADSPPSH